MTLTSILTLSPHDSDLHFESDSTSMEVPCVLYLDLVFWRAPVFLLLLHSFAWLNSCMCRQICGNRFIWECPDCSAMATPDPIRPQIALILSALCVFVPCTATHTHASCFLIRFTCMDTKSTCKGFIIFFPVLQDAPLQTSIYC